MAERRDVGGAVKRLVDAAGPLEPVPAATTDASAVAGSAAWVLIVGAGVLGGFRAAVALAALVLVPLALRLTDAPTRDGRRAAWYRAVVVAQPVAALSAVAALALPPGIVATALALPWAGVTALVACFGLWRLLQRGPWPLSEVAADAGLLYLAVGGGALVLSSAGVALWFRPVVVALTAVHFHYAGFVLPLVAGLAGRLDPPGRWGALWRLSTGVAIVGPGLIAAGIAFSPLVEVVAVAAFTSAVALLSLALLGGVVPRLDGRVPRLLLAVAAVSVTVSMGFAVLYGLAAYTGGTYFGIHDAAFSRMVTYHGRLNALGFALPALVALRLALPASTARPPDIPFSRVASDGRVGPDYLDRNGLVDHDRDASGMVDSLDDYASDGFHASEIHPDVRRFYERSGEYELAVVPEWPRVTRTLAPAYRRLADRIGQLNLPVEPATGDAALDGRVVAVDEAADGRGGSRAWIRGNWNADGAAEMGYVATYARHDGVGGRFLGVAFPLPLANLSGVLRFERLGADDARDGLVLSSHPAPGNADDAGLYLVVAGFGVRLPLNETLTVWPRGLADAPRSPFDADEESAPFDAEPEGSVLARHEVTAFGRRLFALDYAVRPTRSD